MIHAIDLMFILLPSAKRQPNWKIKCASAEQVRPEGESDEGEYKANMLTSLG